MSRDVCGPLLVLLAAAVDHEDPGCPDLFKRGADLFGNLPRAGLDAPALKEQVSELTRSRESCLQSNKELMGYLREDECSAELHALTLADAQLGRISVPVPAEKVSSVASLRRPFCALLALLVRWTCPVSVLYQGLVWHKTSQTAQ